MLCQKKKKKKKSFWNGFWVDLTNNLGQLGLEMNRSKWIIKPTILTLSFNGRGQSTMTCIFYATWSIKWLMTFYMLEYMV